MGNLSHKSLIVIWLQRECHIMLSKNQKSLHFTVHSSQLDVCSCRSLCLPCELWTGVWNRVSSLLLLLLSLSLSSGATLLRDVALARQRKWTFFALAFCNVVPLFFLKSGTLIFDFFCIIIIDVCLHSGFALGSLWVRSAFAHKSGGKGYSNRDEKELKKHIMSP